MLLDLCVDQLKCQSSVEWLSIRMLIECRLRCGSRVSIEGIHRHSTADSFSSHDPSIVYLCMVFQRYVSVRPLVKSLTKSTTWLDKWIENLSWCGTSSGNWPVGIIYRHPVSKMYTSELTLSMEKHFLPKASTWAFASSNWDLILEISASLVVISELSCSFLWKHSESSINSLFFSWSSESFAAIFSFAVASSVIADCNWTSKIESFFSEVEGRDS